MDLSTTDTESCQQSSRLLSLPRELRDLVYSYTLVPSNRIIYEDVGILGTIREQIYIKTTVTVAQPWVESLDISLLLVCKSIYAEAIVILYQEAIFMLRLGVSTIARLQRMSYPHLRHIRHLRLVCTSGVKLSYWDFFAYINKHLRLRRLELDIDLETKRNWKTKSPGLWPEELIRSMPEQLIPLLRFITVTCLPDKWQNELWEKFCTATTKRLCLEEIDVWSQQGHVAELRKPWSQSWERWTKDLGKLKDVGKVNVYIWAQSGIPPREGFSVLRISDHCSVLYIDAHETHRDLAQELDGANLWFFGPSLAVRALYRLGNDGHCKYALSANTHLLEPGEEAQ